MAYRWQDEVAHIRQEAEVFRMRAAIVRHDAEKLAKMLDRDAERTTQRADHIERLCSKKD